MFSRFQIFIFLTDLYVQHYVIKFVSDLRKVGGFLRILQFPPPIKLTPRNNWHIVQSGVKYHQTNKQTQTYTVLDMEYKIKKECAVDIFNAKYFAILGFTFWGMVRTPLQQP
jgi:hypothetical protein